MWTQNCLNLDLTKTRRRCALFRHFRHALKMRTISRNANLSPENLCHCHHVQTNFTKQLWTSLLLSVPNQSFQKNKKQHPYDWNTTKSKPSLFRRQRSEQQNTTCTACDSRVNIKYEQIIHIIAFCGKRKNASISTVQIRRSIQLHKHRNEYHVRFPWTLAWRTYIELEVRTTTWHKLWPFNPWGWSK